MKTAVINIKQIFSDELNGISFVGSRLIGEKIREEMDLKFGQNIDRITLDFLGIDEISQSFGDEIIGIYIRAFGTTFVRDKIALNNANQSIIDTLNFVVSYSKKKVAI